MSLPGLFLSFSKINGFTGSRPEGQAVSAPRLWPLGYMPLHTHIVTPPGVHLSVDPAPASAPWELISQRLVFPVRSFPGCLMLWGFFRLLIGWPVISVVNLPDDIHAVHTSLSVLFCKMKFYEVISPVLWFDWGRFPAHLCNASLAHGKALSCPSVALHDIFIVLAYFVCYTVHTESQST